MKRISILGAIAGDIIGSKFEFIRPRMKEYDFDMFDNQHMTFTDDTVCTIAIADWILHDKKLLVENLVKLMQQWCRKYTGRGYGGRFYGWIYEDNPQPYNSWGNGSAMRVSPCGFAFDSLEKTLQVAKISAEFSHNHIKGIKGAQATAAAIFLARTGKTKQEIKDYITDNFAYDLNHTCEELKPTYRFHSSCQKTVPESIIAFFDSKNYEDAIRLTISLGGDTDTMGAITGPIAAAFYKEMPDNIYDFALSKLPEDMKEIISEFDNKFLK